MPLVAIAAGIGRKAVKQCPASAASEPWIRPDRWRWPRLVRLAALVVAPLLHPPSDGQAVAASLDCLLGGQDKTRINVHEWRPSRDQMFGWKVLNGDFSRIGVAEAQARLIKDEPTGVSTLVDKGLATAPRQLELERDAAGVAGDRLRINSVLLNAVQDISKTEIEILDARNKRANEVTYRRDTQAKLEELGYKSDTSLLYPAEVSASQFLVERTRAAKTPPTFRFV